MHGLVLWPLCFPALGKLPSGPLYYVLLDGPFWKEDAQSWTVIICSLTLCIQKNTQLLREWSLLPHKESDDLLTQIKIRIRVLKSKNVLNINRSCYLLVTYCCVSNYSKILWLTTTNICYLTVISVGWEPRYDSAGCLWPRVSHKADI